MPAMLRKIRDDRPADEDAADERFGSATWNGDLREAKGPVSTESRAPESRPYTFFSRYEVARVPDRPALRSRYFGFRHTSVVRLSESLSLQDAIDPQSTLASVYLPFSPTRIDCHKLQ